MPTLAIDTATETLSLALGDGGALLGDTSIAAGRSHLEILLPTVDKLLREHDCPVAGLQAICVGIGPGTFSGLRVGVATARGLAQGLKLPLAGSSSLKALAAGLAGNAGNEGKNLLPVIDAKRGQVFAQLFSSNKAGKVEPLSEIMCLSANDLITSLNRQAEGPIIAGGDGALVYLDRFTDAGIEVPGVDDASNHIQARYHLDAADGEPGFSLEGIAGVIPAYVRNPDADKTILLRKKEPWLK